MARGEIVQPFIERDEIAMPILHPLSVALVMDVVWSFTDRSEYSCKVRQPWIPDLEERKLPR